MGLKTEWESVLTISSDQSADQDLHCFERACNPDKLDKG